MPVIRLATTADAAALAQIYAPHCRDSAVSFEEDPPAEAEMAARIARVGAERPWLVLEDAGVPIAYAYASPHNERAAYRWSVSTAIYVHAGHHRRGAGRALYTALFDLLRGLGYYTATAGITLPNAGSVGLHEAFGFTLVGVYRGIGYKLGGWRDVGWYQMTLRQPDRDPAAPRPMASLAGTDAFDRAAGLGLACYVQHS